MMEMQQKHAQQQLTREPTNVKPVKNDDDEFLRN